MMSEKFPSNQEKPQNKSSLSSKVQVLVVNKKEQGLI